MTVAGLIDEAARLISIRDYAGAIALLKPSVETGGARNAQVSYLLACAELYAGDLPAAEGRFRVLLEAGHQPANCAYYLDEIALRLQAPTLATCYFSGAVRLDPQHKSALERLRASSTAGPPDSPAQPLVPSQSTTGPRPPHAPRSATSAIGVITETRGPTPVPTLAGPATAQQLDVFFEEHDRDGQPLGRSMVYLRGVKIKGAVSHGDWIELPDDVDNDGRVRKLRNLTTNKEIMSKSSVFYPGS